VNPLIIALESFPIFSKFLGDICKSRYTSGINGTSAKFATNTASVVDTGGKFATCVNVTGRKFAACINDTGGNLPSVSTKLAANNGNTIRLLINLLIEDFFYLPPVSTTPVVHLKLRISPQIFEKIQNGPFGILWGWGNLIHEKNFNSKIS
jgi:hypothetical protein